MYFDDVKISVSKPLTYVVTDYYDVTTTATATMMSANYLKNLFSFIREDLSGISFDEANFKRIHFAGHPEGNKDIDPDGSLKNVNAALKWKQNYSDQSDAKVCLTTQFSFDVQPILKWMNDLSEMGINVPVHIGVAGPAKLQTLLKFAVECGVGASLGVLKKRARDIRKLLLPYEPTELLSHLALEIEKQPKLNIEQIHFFPLGGIKTSASWACNNSFKSEFPAIKKG